MGRHRSHRAAPRWVLPTAGAAAVALVIALTVNTHGGDRDTAAPPAPTPAAACDTVVRVLTASSFLPVLDALGPRLGSGADCVSVVAEAVDGRAGAARAAANDVDVWIADDLSWTGSVPDKVLAPTATPLGDAAGAGGSEEPPGTLLATSPIYMVTDADTAGRVGAAGGTWLALANLLGAADGVRLAIRDPAGSGDGMVAAGAVAEAVWLDKDMDASALALAKAAKVTRTVAGAEAALPAMPGEVGLVPEYALLPRLTGGGADLSVLTGQDHTALLRYTFLPLARASDDPDQAAGIGRLRAALTGPAGTAALRAANLRRPDAPAAPPPHDRLPPLAAEPFAALGKHHVDHVFATWYAPDRRSNILLVVDASGSMGDPAPGTATPLIELVRRGARSLTDLLPDDSRVGVWEFGSELAGTSDHRVLLSSGDLAGPHRARLNATIDKLAARRTGTGLYDTILNAYRAGVSFYRPGLPNHVLVFTDGRNQDDAGSISLAQLGAGLARAQDPRRPVQLSVVAFGQRAEAERLEAVFEPVDGYVGTVGSPEEVAAVFIHQAAGGLHAH